jgi:tetratricopeptide (TPR) repeat protein
MLAEDLRGLWGQSNFAAARKLDEEALGMRRLLYFSHDYPDVSQRELIQSEISQSMSNLAKDLRGLGGENNLTAARKLDEDALELLRRLSAGQDNPEIANSLSDLAELHRQFGEWSEARELDEEALQMRRRLYGDGDPGVRQSMSNLAKDLRGLGGAEDLARARKLEADVLAMRSQVEKVAGRIRPLLRGMRGAMYRLIRAFPPTGIY